MQMRVARAVMVFFLLAVFAAPAVWIGSAPLAAASPVWVFLGQGILHIWLGLDHLLFVLCLSLMARGTRLVTLISAFTIGHSISLACAFYQLFPIPAGPVEAVIALSIIFMAYEALTGRERPRPSAIDRQIGIVAVFGLVHGLGFASALGELRIDGDARFLSLMFFNLGIEVGQLAFVGAIAVVMTGLRTIAIHEPVRRVALQATAVAGCIVALQRIAA